MLKRLCSNSNIGAQGSHKISQTPTLHTPLWYKGTIHQARGNYPKLIKEGKTYSQHQHVMGTFLYYGRAVDNAMLAVLCALASEQSNPTEATMKKNANSS